MPRTDYVERTIFDIEGFRVNFIKNGKNLRGEVQQPYNYSGERATKGTFTVYQFIKKLKSQFPGYDFEVLKENGESALGMTNLSTVRATYNG